jgi:hypothetical protein
MFDVLMSRASLVGIVEHISGALRRRPFHGSIRIAALLHLVRDSPHAHARVFPKLPRDLDGVDTGDLPPCPLVGGTMDRTVMGAAERHGEVVAGFAVECAGCMSTRLDGECWPPRLALKCSRDNRCMLRSPPQINGVVMANRSKWREWTKQDVSELKSSARQKRPAAKIAKSLKRTLGATRQKAFALGVSLDSRG